LLSRGRAHVRERRIIFDRAFFGKRVLVTGAGGFIGSHVADRLAAVDCTLALIDREFHAVGPKNGDTSWHALDIGSPAFRTFMTEGAFDHIFHFAGNANVSLSVREPDRDFRENCLATFEMLEALRCASFQGVFVYASSAAVYGNPVRLPIAESDPTNPISPYGVSKLAAERYLKTYCALYGLKGLSLRMFSPFGPRLRKQIVFDLTRRALAHPELEVFGDGTQARDFIYVDDLVSAIFCLTCGAPHDGSAFNIGRGIATSTREIAEELLRIVGGDLTIRYNHTATPGDPDRWQADISTLTRLGWSPSTSLAAGLAQTVQWIARENP
jgi:nucleoside-diphosphate-sugar epimerase